MGLDFYKNFACCSLVNDKLLQQFMNTNLKIMNIILLTLAGCVEGIVCPQFLEDEVRLDIDEAIKAIKPSVFPNVYDVKFTPVFYKLGVPKGN